MTSVSTVDLVTPANGTRSSDESSANVRNPNSVTTTNPTDTNLEGKGGHLARTVGALTLSSLVARSC